MIEQRLPTDEELYRLIDRATAPQRARSPKADQTATPEHVRRAQRLQLEQASRDSYVAVPIRSSKPIYAPLERAIQQSGIDANVEPHQMAIYVTHFLERLADEVASGLPVSIPGFGRFAAVWYQRPGRHGSVQPRFYAARGFRQQANLYCSEDIAKANGPSLESYRRSHHLCSTRAGKVGSVVSAMRRLRAGWRRTAGPLLNPNA